MQNVDAASRGVFEAVKEYNGSLAKRTPKIVYTFGANSDQNNNNICPDYTLASAVIKMDACFAATVQEAKDGKFKTGVIRGGPGQRPCPGGAESEADGEGD